MKIDTTINIKEEILKRVDETAIELNVTRSHLVSLLVERVTKVKNPNKNRFSRVKYQKREKNASWKRPHVLLESNVYEKCIDMRKLFKMSVSFIIYVAFHLHFMEVIEEAKKGINTDKNHRNYLCIGKNIGNVFSYTVFWDYPPDKNLIKFLE